MCTGMVEDTFLFDSRDDKSELRRRLRRLRRDLSPQLRSVAADRVATSILAHLRRERWRRIAAYAAVASELDLSPLFAQLPEQIELHLPAIDGETMCFRRWRPGDPLVAGRHGIAQPADGAAVVEPARLDGVFLPLLGFDRGGNRLGSGAGYYDRSFALRLNQPPPPRLIGVAFAVQEVAELPHDPWDVPLDAIVTERAWLEFTWGGD